ncbi:hypothetical protein VCHA54P499_10316 [Vibrio chagasii]|nr:hypothetical protein VCHA54P499_10316 [Vibrio chagasii]CAH7092159.1 hypothetical protein VCHA53O466_10283 [Vibrio chagasii]
MGTHLRYILVRYRDFLRTWSRGNVVRYCFLPLLPLNQPSAEGLIPKPAGEQLYLSILREFIVALLPNDVNPKKGTILTFYYISRTK